MIELCYEYLSVRCIWLHVLIMSKYAFQSEFTLCNCLNVKKLLAPNRCDIWSLSDCNGTRTHNRLVRKRTLNHLAKWAKWLSCVVSTYLYGAFYCILLSCQVQVSEWILAWSRHHIWSLSDSNKIQTHNLVRTQTLNPLANIKIEIKSDF